MRKNPQQGNSTHVAYHGANTNALNVVFEDTNLSASNQTAMGNRFRVDDFFLRFVTSKKHVGWFRADGGNEAEVVIVEG